jgi:hypothetical protein
MAQGFLARVGGRIQQLFAITTSAGAADADKIPALGSDGRLDISMMPVGVGANVVVATASESLSAGRFVNLFVDAGVLKMRLADNSNGRPAWGYVREAVAADASGSAYRLNTVNANLTGLTPGSDYWLGTAGGLIATALDPETDAGKVDQYLGMSSSATELVTVEHAPVYL